MSKQNADSPSSTEPEPPAGADTVPLDDDLDVALPDAVAEAFRTSLDADESPQTLAGWVDLLAALFDDWPPAVADLCHTTDGPHRARVAAQSFRFACVLDAMLLPFLRDEPATITSNLQGGDGDITMRVTRQTVTGPSDAVVSFGAASRPPEGTVTSAHAYGAICPFIHVFPDRLAYADWAADVDGATMALSLPTALGLAKAMAEA